MAAGVSILSDLPYPRSGACSGDISTEMETGRRALQHKYNPREAAWFYIVTCKATAHDCVDLKWLDSVKIIALLKVLKTRCITRVTGWHFVIFHVKQPKVICYEKICYYILYVLLYFIVYFRFDSKYIILQELLLKYVLIMLQVKKHPSTPFPSIKENTSIDPGY